MRGGLIQRQVPQQSLSDTPVYERRKRSRKNKLISEVVDVVIESEDPEEVQKEGDDPVEDVHKQGDDAGEDANPTEHAHPVADETINKEHEAENESEHTDAATGLPSSQTPDSNSKNKRKRGPTRMRKVAKDPEDRVKVLFSQLGEHAGSGSVTLSSFLGVLVREHVPVLYNRWDKVDAQTKDTLWEEIQVYVHEIVYTQKMVYD